MKNQSHTLGPWVIQGETTLHILSKASAKGRRVCAIQPNPQSEDLANANLIAAAPEMLEALESLLSRVENLDADARAACLKQIDTAKSVLQKARGEK